MRSRWRRHSMFRSMFNDKGRLQKAEASSPKSREPVAHLEEAREVDAALGRALALVRYLRAHCPWDARQDPISLRPYLLEEAHEVAAAIEEGDDSALLSELGDLLLNVAFQIVLAEERESFDGPAVIETLESKMRLRHPHIYGDAAEPPDWEALKAEERAADESAEADPRQPASSDPFEGVPEGLEPLSRALRFQDRMAAIGFDWPDAHGPLEKVREETEELARLVAEPPRGAAHAAASEDPDRRVRVEEELGDLLFAAVNLARRFRVHPSNALLRATSKFQRRSREMWRRAVDAGLDPDRMTLEQLDALWEAVKREE